MELLRRELEIEYINNGNTKKVIQLSQQLDKLIAKEQIERFKCFQMLRN